MAIQVVCPFCHKDVNGVGYQVTIDGKTYMRHSQCYTEEIVEEPKQPKDFVEGDTDEAFDRR